MELVAHVRSKADRLIQEHGRISDEHLMLMSAVLIADELWDESAGKPNIDHSAQSVAKPPTRRKAGKKAAEPAINPDIQ